MRIRHRSPGLGEAEAMDWTQAQSTYKYVAPAPPPTVQTNAAGSVDAARAIAVAAAQQTAAATTAANALAASQAASTAQAQQAQANAAIQAANAAIQAANAQAAAAVTASQQASARAAQIAAQQHASDVSASIAAAGVQGITSGLVDSSLDLSTGGAFINNGQTNSSSSLGITTSGISSQTMMLAALAVGAFLLLK